MHTIKLSPYAKVFYTEWLLAPDSPRYNLSIDQTMYGDIDVKRLTSALKKYVSENFLLNSHIKNVNGKPYWTTNNFIIELEYSDNPLSTSTLQNYISNSFDLHNGPLYRFKLVRVGDRAYRFIVVMHHIVIDGSPALDSGVFEAISNYYNDENYTVAQNKSISKQIAIGNNLAKALATKLKKNKSAYKKFWKQQLSNIDNLDLHFLRINSDHIENVQDGNQVIGAPRTTDANTVNTIDIINFSFGTTELTKLNQLKLQYGVTPYIYGLCIYAILLHRYTGQERLAIGHPIAIREGQNFTCGSQVNTNLIPYKFGSNTTILDLFNQSKDFLNLTIYSAPQYGYYPISDIIQASNNKHLLNIYFAKTYFREKPFTFYGVNKVETHAELGVDGAAKDVLLLEHNARDNEHTIDYRIRYDANSFDTELVNNFITIYKKLYIEILDDLLTNRSDKRLANYHLLTDEQYHKLVVEFNRTAKAYPKTKTVHALFEEQATKNPTNIAVVYGTRKLTYKQLNQKANQLAHHLISNYNIQPDDPIVICLDKSEYIPIAILSILKAGGAYVPIDSKHPDERILHILQDTRTKVILTNRRHQERLQNIVKQTQLAENEHASANIVAIDNKAIWAQLAKQLTNNPVTSTTGSNLIYIIYTSGTTGTPKGVLIEHHSVINYALFLIDEAQLNDQSRGSQYAALSFDASVSEIFPILLSGGNLYIVKKENRLDIKKINDFFHHNHITYGFLPTKFAELFFQLENHTLRNLIVGGEKIDKFIKRTYRVINAYGPTETTVQPTCFIIDKQYHNIPIGKPIYNATYYVTDRNLNIMPIGAIGELMIGGDCVGRSYLNLPNLTAEKFIPNPFQTTEEKKYNRNNTLYRSGDLVRVLPDGNLEYLGRNDTQIKIRGYRIELGEIEQKLSNYPAIKQAIVMASNGNENGNDGSEKPNTNEKYLVAYYVAKTKLDEKKIQNYLATQLPEYMVPKAMAHLKSLPLTPNGKLNVKELPIVKYKCDRKYVPPRNEQEQRICHAFEKTLCIKKIGIYDDFFELGGSSIQAIQLVTILQNDFDIRIADIFKLRSPIQIAQNVYFGKDILRKKLEQVKISYQNKRNTCAAVDEQLQKRITTYLESAKRQKENCFTKKPITNVLLTGATGYLGCNILNQLLQLTNYKIFLLIRAKSQAEAAKRINKKLRFYFDKTLANIDSSRVVIIKSNIEENNLGLARNEYKALAKKIDSVIHAAALVKHYGEYNKFYSANVQATINLLEFTKLTKLKDFHYISTYSILNCGFIPNCTEYIYTESDSPDNLELWDNVYIRTKLQGERETIKYRSYGIQSNIYRVGNLAFMAENHRAQENIEDNAFFNWLKCLFKMRCVAQELNLVEISPVDLTAQALVKIFDKNQLANSTYHVFNPHLFNPFNVFANDRATPATSLTMEQFVDNIANNLSNNIYHDLITRFLLHQGWLDGWNIKNTTSIKVLQNRTQHILKQLGFEWRPITNETFNKYLLDTFKLHGVNEMTQKAKIFEHLEKLANLFPMPIYWLGLNQEYLGINNLVTQGTGTLSYDRDFAGKTLYDIYPKDMAEELVKHHKEVIKTDKIISFEETIRDIATKEIKYLNTTIAPLHDDENIIGTMGFPIDVTAAQKEAKHLKTSKVLEHIGRVISLIPTPIYWLGLNQEYLGINDLVIKGTGTRSYEQDFAGKTPYDLYPKEMAEEIVQHHREVIQTGKMLAAKESIKEITTKKTKYFNAFIAPLYDDDGKILGTIGTSIDITAEKEAEHLKLENELQQTKLEEQEKFKKAADQVAHDIRSPLASLLMVVKSCESEISESARIALREAAVGIGDIANNLLSKYKKTDSEAPSGLEKRHPIMISLILSQVLTDKKYQYKSLPIKLHYEAGENSGFTFISANPSALKRMISNLINNSVEACKDDNREINIKLDIANKKARITIQDNGQGMPQKVVNRIMQNVRLSIGKRNGHGIGLTQVREALQQNNGTMEIHSKVGSGTKVILTFPVIDPPEWIANKIQLYKNDTVIVLDDDTSIHGAWDTRFDEYVQNNNINLQHFSSGKEAIDFIDSFPDKSKIFLLTDFELLKQELTGLHVIERTNIARSILVTSHYANSIVQNLAEKSGTKILPKQLASEIPIFIEERMDREKTPLKEVDIVIIDDNEMVTNVLSMLLENKGKTVDKYYNPFYFLDNIAQYPKNTKICMDNDFKKDITGIDLAKKLHEAGYTRLYLFTGKDFAPGDIPKYLTVISKTDYDNLYRHLLSD
jgi:amino acid adenylation domain-containing protein/thioester reductase-like protein